MKRKDIVDLVQMALMSGMLCILAPLAVPLPVSPVPVTLATFAVYLTAGLLGAKKGSISVVIYLLLGMVGLPVFSGFTGGIGVLAGPTGGYLIGYVPCAFLAGWLMEKRKQVVWNICAMTLGTLLCYTFGTVWFLFMMDGTYSVAQALVVCVVPYLAFDAVKIVLAGVLLMPVKRMLHRAGISG